MHIAPRYSFNRPANTTQYAQNELVANHATAGSVVPMRFGVSPIRGRGKIVRVRVFTDNEAVTTATFNLHLFSRPPVPTNGDNGAFAVDTARYFIGTVACDLATGAFVTTTDKCKGFVITGGLVFDTLAEAPALEGGAIYGLLETAAGATYTPASEELFEVTVEIEGLPS